MDFAVEIGRRERKRLAVHQTLLDAASRLFAERGVSRTTVDDIAEAADVARQTVFNHFPYKEAFALELGAEGVDKIAQHAYVSLEAGVPALEVLSRSAHQLLDCAIAQGECMVVVARELLHPDVERAARAAERVPLCHLIEGVLLQAREEGSIRDDLPIDIVATRMSAILTSILAQIMTREPQILRRDLSVCFDIWLNGISERSN